MDSVMKRLTGQVPPALPPEFLDQNRPCIYSTIQYKIFLTRTLVERRIEFQKL